MNNNSATESTTYATFWERLHAYIFDNILFLPLGVLDMYNLLTWKSIWIPIATTIIWCIYKPLLEWKYGATWGKKIVGLKVVNAHNQSIDFNQAMLRFAPFFALSLVNILNMYNLLQIPDFHEITNLAGLQELQVKNSNLGSTIASFFFLFSVVGIFYNPNKQAHHDAMANTYCIKLPPKPWKKK